MMLLRWSLCGAALCLGTLATATFAQGVEAVVALRDGGASKSGALLREGADGIEIQVQDGAGSHTQFLRWDQIRTLTAVGASAAREKRLAAGAMLWRGRSRLDRGDLAGARIMFTRAAESIDSSAVLARMMVQEAIARTAAVDLDRWDESLAASLTAATMRARVAVPSEWLATPSAFDADSGLILGIAPVWLDGASAKRAQQRFVAEALRARDQNEVALAQLFTLCARIAAADAGNPEKSPARVTAAAPADDGEVSKLAGQSVALEVEPALEPASFAARAAARLGVRVLTGWADAVSADAPARKRGRETLHAIARAESGAVRMWAIYGEGRSLVMEDDADKVRLGVGKMLLIPAAYGAESPRLAEAALVQSSIALARIHDDESAAVLRALHTQTTDSDRLEVQSNTGATP